VSTPASRAFLPALRDVGRDLSLPLRERVHILRELACDLDAFQGRLLAEGLSADEARRRAVEALVPDGDTVAELNRLHMPMYGRITRRVAQERLRLLERWGLAAATLFVLLGETLGLTRVRLLGDPSAFLWPVLGLGALMLGVVVANGFQLWIKGDHRPPERSLPGILALAGVTVGVGVSGAVVDLYALAGALERAPELALALATAWLVRDATLVAVSVLLALAGGLAWFVLSQWLARTTGAYRDVLGVTGRNNR
jgi:hypothetical protein